jgi:hypothetical protein
MTFCVLTSAGFCQNRSSSNFDRADLKGVKSEKDDLFYIPQFEGIREGYVGGYHQGAMRLRAGSSGAYCLERCSGR